MKSKRGEILYLEFELRIIYCKKYTHNTEKHTNLRNLQKIHKKNMDPMLHNFNALHKDYRYLNITTVKISRGMKKTYCIFFYIIHALSIFHWKCTRIINKGLGEHLCVRCLWHLHYHTDGLVQERYQGQQSHTDQQYNRTVGVMREQNKGG